MGIAGVIDNWPWCLGITNVPFSDLLPTWQVLSCVYWWEELYARSFIQPHLFPFPQEMSCTKITHGLYFHYKWWQDVWGVLVICVLYLFKGPNVPITRCLTAASLYGYWTTFLAVLIAFTFEASWLEVRKLVPGHMSDMNCPSNDSKRRQEQTRWHKKNEHVRNINSSCLVTSCLKKAFHKHGSGWVFNIYNSHYVYTRRDKAEEFWVCGKETDEIKLKSEVWAQSKQREYR